MNVHEGANCCHSRVAAGMGGYGFLYEICSTAAAIDAIVYGLYLCQRCVGYFFPDGDL